MAWRRRRFHLQRNVVGCVPQAAMRREIARAIRGVFDAPDKETADSSSLGGENRRRVVMCFGALPL